MDEQNNGLPTERPLSTPEKKNKKLTKKILLGIGLVILAYLLYSVLHIFISPDRRIQQIYLIPDDAAFIIQSSNPVEDWKTFSNSDAWQTLKKTQSVSEITQKAETLDSIIQNNKNLLSLVGKRDMLISIHQTRSTDWDYLMVVDMQKTSKLNSLKDQIELVLKLAGNTVTHRIYNEINILEMRDPETRDILYAAFVDNHFIASYTSRLVEKSIDTRNKPKIGLEYAYIESEKKVAGKGLYRIFINYAALPRFMSIYLGGKNEYLDLFSNSMDFGGLYFTLEKEKLELKGYSYRKETPDPYVTAMLHSGKHKMKAHEILSARTALYTNIGINDPQTFVKELEKIMSTTNPELFATYQSSRKRIESLFGISLDEHFLSWMSGEFALSQSEPGLLGREPEYILAIRAKSIKEAQKNMDFIEKKIKSRTPIHIKTVNYKEFEINYVEMKGFFRLFFGSLFDTFEKPYYTFVDDYVVFSNKPASLLSFLEDYEQKNFLKNSTGFKQAYSSFNASSTLFMYTDIHKFYPQLLPMLNVATRSELQANQNTLYSFPYWTMQVTGENEWATLHNRMDYKPYIPEVLVVKDADEADSEMNENAETERELMSELKRFYIEKFQGNVLREFYPEGALKSETEVKEGKRHGRYREYFENGKLKTRGKYVNNRPKGTWKHYTEEGKFERKEKF